MINFKLYTSLAILLSCVTIVFITLELLSIWWLILCLVFGFIVVIIASLNMGWHVFIKCFTHKKTTKKIISLTFDDGPHPEFTPKVLALLKQYETKATFFCIGKHIEKYPELTKAIVNEGHVIGNHSYSHSNTIGFNNTKSWVEEIDRTDQLIEQETGLKTNLFRPPFGVTTPHLAAALKKTNHSCIGWNNRSFDTFINSPKTISNRVLKQATPGGIILLHDTQANCIPVLEHLLQVLQSEHYKMVTINDLRYEN